MSFSDEQDEPSGPGPDAHLMVSQLTLVDIKIAWERANGIIPDVIMAFRSGDSELMLEALGSLVDGLTVIRCELGLDDVDEDDEPGEASGIERLTRNGGRTDDPQAMDTSRWREPGHGD